MNSDPFRLKIGRKRPDLHSIRVFDENSGNGAATIAASEVENRVQAAGGCGMVVVDRGSAAGGEAMEARE